MSKFAGNCAAEKISDSWPSIYYYLFGIAMVRSENGVFHINILRAFTKSQHVIFKSSISER